MKTVKAILLDIDGTLIFQGRPLPGAVEALEQLRASDLSLRLLTNISAQSTTRISNDLGAMGLSVAPHEIQTASSACVDYLRARPGVRCHLMLPQTTLPLFNEIQIDDEAPDAVVIGDMGEEFNFERLNRAFRMLRNGAELIALQKNLFWFDGDGPKLDCGAFILGLEAAADTIATVMGKPSAIFFQMALDHLQLSPEEVLVVGDDVKTDVAGARGIGARCVLVGTGKYRAGAGSEAAADYFLPSVGQLPELLGL